MVGFSALQYKRALNILNFFIHRHRRKFQAKTLTKTEDRRD